MSFYHIQLHFALCQASPGWDLSRLCLTIREGGRSNKIFASAVFEVTAREARIARFAAKERRYGSKMMARTAKRHDLGFGRLRVAAPCVLFLDLCLTMAQGQAPTEVHIGGLYAVAFTNVRERASHFRRKRAPRSPLTRSIERTTFTDHDLLSLSRRSWILKSRST